MSLEYQKSHIAVKLQKNRETIVLWIQGIQQYGLLEFLDEYEAAKKGKRTPRKVNPIIRDWIYQIREREMDCCGQKIQYFLRKDHNTELSVAKIYEILAEKYNARLNYFSTKTPEDDGKGYSVSGSTGEPPEYGR